MGVEVSKEKLMLNKFICEKKETIVVQGDMIVPDSKPDILSTLNTSGMVSIYKKEVQNGRVRIDGNVNAYIMYLADSSEDKIRGLNTSLDFSENFIISDCTLDMRAELETCIKNIECKVLNGRKVNIKVTLETRIKVFASEEAEIICDLVDKNIQVLKPTHKINSLIGAGETKTYIKETINIDTKDNLAEILKCNLRIINKDTKISYNKILAKAEIELKMTYLTEENQIKVITCNLPVVGFIDMPNITENSICDVNYQVKNAIIKPNSIEEHSIYVEIEMEISAECYEEKEINLIEDLYSTTSNIEFNKRSVTTIANKMEKTKSLNVNTKLNIPEIIGNELIDIDINPTIVKTNKTNSKITYEGELQLTLLYSDENQAQTNSKNAVIPFEITIENIENVEKLEEVATVEVQSSNCKVEGGAVNCSIDLMLNVGLQQNANLEIIEEINESEIEDPQDYSIIIYIVKKGDTLWEIAKRFRSTVDDIVRVNGLENPNKIDVGEKLYIPKTVRTLVNHV